MKIGELAEEAGVTAKTVRFYESIGLMFEPNRSASGYRDYDHSALDRLRFIRDAQQTGLTLTEIHSLLDFKDAGIGACDHTKAFIANHLADLDRQIARLSQTPSSTPPPLRTSGPSRPPALHRPQPLPSSRHPPPPARCDIGLK